MKERKERKEGRTKERKHCLKTTTTTTTSTKSSPALRHPPSPSLYTQSYVREACTFAMSKGSKVQKTGASLNQQKTHRMTEEWSAGRGRSTDGWREGRTERRDAGKEVRKDENTR